MYGQIMDISLKPELESFVSSQIGLGKYRDSNQMIEEALKLLEKRLQYDQWVQELEQKIDVAVAQLERGEGVDGEVAIAQLRQRFR